MLYCLAAVQLTLRPALLADNAAKARRKAYSKIGDQAGSDALCGVGIGWF
jgi:hypothetical protein